MGRMQPPLSSSPVIKRHNGGEPVLTRRDIPYESDCIYSASVVKTNGQYVMAFRNDYRFDGTEFEKSDIGIAFSGDGVTWHASRSPLVTAEGYPNAYRMLDPRLTAINGQYFLCFTVHTKYGMRSAVARTDFNEVEILSLSAPGLRYAVMHPERVNGRYLRYFATPPDLHSRTLGGLWVSKSSDMVNWGDPILLLSADRLWYGKHGIGPCVAPVKTDRGWLMLIYASDYDHKRGKNGWGEVWQSRYCAGLALLDLEDPTKVLSLYDKPLIAPETKHELENGYRTNVIYPSGIIPEPNGEVKIYYCASDTVVCLATSHMDELLGLFN